MTLFLERVGYASRTMKISVITPTHDLKFLGDVWRSLLSQTHQDFEWVVSVNDKTGGRTRVKERRAEVEAMVEGDERVKVLEDFSPFVTVGARKLFAFSVGTGDALVELDHDDILVPEGLEEIGKAFDDPEIGFVYSDWADFVDSTTSFQGNMTYRAPHLRPGWMRNGFSFYDQEVGGVRPGTYDCVKSLPSTALTVSHIHTAPNHVRAWRRSAYEELGGHNADYKICDDHELVCRTYGVTRFAHIEKALYLYRITGQNTWAQHESEIGALTQKLQREYLERLVLRECELLGLPAFDLGGGIEPRAGWKTVDIEDGADVKVDLKERWPWEDGSVGAFRASDFLEHLPDKLYTMSEIHRCLRKGGWLLSLTPSALGPGGFMDPTHCSYWVEESFWYYVRSQQARYIRNNTMRFKEVHLESFNMIISGKNVPYVTANLVKI
jgi:O-antigen biosynthesis protein